MASIFQSNNLHYFHKNEKNISYNKDLILVFGVQILVYFVDLDAGIRAGVGGPTDLNVVVGGAGLDCSRVDILSLG